MGIIKKSSYYNAQDWYATGSLQQRNQLDECVHLVVDHVQPFYKFTSICAQMPQRVYLVIFNLYFVLSLPSVFRLITVLSPWLG